MHRNLDEIDRQTDGQESESSDVSSSRPSSPESSTSSSPSSSSDGSTSSSDLDPKDALQSPLTGLLHFEGFSMPHIRNFGISNLDMPNLPSLPNLRSFNMPRFQRRLPDLAQNLSNNLPNLQNLTPNMLNFQIPNLSYLSQLRNVDTAAELQNLFNLFRISANLPALPTLPNLPTLANLPTLPNLPALPQLPQISQFLARGQLLKPRTELCGSVRNMHRRLNEITQRLPNHFFFHECTSEGGEELVRIYFILNESLHYCDTPLGNQRGLSAHRSRNLARNSSHKTRYKGVQPCSSASSGCKTTITDLKSPGGSRNDLLSAQPLHPQKIVGARVKYYEAVGYGNDRSRFVFSDGLDLYHFDYASDTCDIVSPMKIRSTNIGPKLDLQINPIDPDLISYIYDGDLWCANLRTSQEIRLTNFHDIISNKSGATNSINSPLISNDNYYASPVIIGRPSYIIKEEFKRHRGYWWRKISNGSKDESATYVEHQILYEETDQSQVDLVIIQKCDGILESQRFPKPGASNPISHLKVATFKVSKSTSEIYDIQLSNVGEKLRVIFPEYEYLVRVGWFDQDTFWVQMLDRRQTHLVLALVNLENTFKTQMIYEETNDLYWIGAHDLLYFLDCSEHILPSVGNESEISFVWSSEESGFRHLYLIKVKIEDKNTSPNMIMKRQLTEGNWEVDKKDLWVDEANMLIYFCGLRDSPLEKHLYVVSYADCMKEQHNHVRYDISSRNKVHRLTELNFTQSSIAFNPTRSIFVNIQSNITVPPYGFMNVIVPHASRSHKRDSKRLPDSKRSALILVNSFLYNHQEKSQPKQARSIERKSSVSYDCQLDLLPGLGKPELFCCQLSSGELIYGSIFKPEFMESGVRYPTVLEIYGGPEVQLVSNNFMSLRQPTRHLLSSEGYVVVLIDCRGSAKRGLNFEAHAFHRMGQVEIKDQVEVLNWLAKNTEYIDLDRVAIKGWSYGGYLALMALAQYPKTFKIAIAGAPLVNWNAYDSAYTEKFMGQPNENPDGYYKGNILNHVNLFPDQENRLLILHGMMDENVHFSSHTIALIKALIEAGKPYDLQVFPNERHILSSPSSYEAYIICVLSYLQLNL